MREQPRPPDRPSDQRLVRELKRLEPSALALGACGGFALEALGVFDLFGLTQPVIAITACAIAGHVLVRFRARKVLIGADLGLLLLLFLIASTPLVDGVGRRWVRQDVPSPGVLDAIVVLSSGGLHSDSSLDVTGAERLLAGLSLMKAGVASRLVTTRTHDRVHDQDIASDAGQRRLIELAGAERSWVVVDSVHTTRDEATQVARLLLPLGAKRVAVVTSPLHTRRACAAFEAVGFLVRCVPAREHEFSTRDPITARDRVAVASQLFYERLGMLKYGFKGWLPAR